MTDHRLPALIEDLNAYERTHDRSAISAEAAYSIWQDVIFGAFAAREDGDESDLEYDEDLTAEIEHGSSDRFALNDGTVIRFEPSTGEWTVAGSVEDYR